MGSPTVSKAQSWFRIYSENLASSYRASALIEHRVTKGETREHQIVDFLRGLLRTRAAVETGVVIADSKDAQSSKFDAVLLDRLYWPRLFQQDNTAVVMVESVLAAIEVKSELNAEETADIFKKSASLRSMAYVGKRAGSSQAIVTAFAYSCDNLLLAFYDYATSYARSPELSATTICVLNKGLLCLCRRDGGSLVPESTPSAGLVPAMASMGPDALLMYVYLLSGWASLRSGAADVYRAYSRQVFASASVSYFDDDYMQLINRDPATSVAARAVYKRQGSLTFEEAYDASRRAIGLTGAR